METALHVSGSILLGILLGAHPVLHISRIRVKEKVMV
jgi:hypothetical protein